MATERTWADELHDAITAAARAARVARDAERDRRRARLEETEAALVEAIGALQQARERAWAHEDSTPQGRLERGRLFDAISDAEVRRNRALLDWYAARAPGARGATD